jgi:hypothetical protein
MNRRIMCTPLKNRLKKESPVDQTVDVTPAARYNDRGNGDALRHRLRKSRSQGMAPRH